MFDIGWTELLVLGAIALIVVGPKELPGMLRTLGQMVGRARGMAREFQRSMDDAAREMDVKELRDLQRSATDWKSKLGPNAPRAYAEKTLRDAMEGAEKLGEPRPAPTPPASEGAEPAATIDPAAPTPPVAPSPAAAPPARGS